MQIQDLNGYFNTGSITTAAVSENTYEKKQVQFQKVTAFDDVLNDFLSKDVTAASQNQADEDGLNVKESAGETEEGNSDYLSGLSENLLNTGSGRKVIASMVENQIMGIVTGNADEETGETLQSILLGIEETDNVSELEKTLLELNTIETQTDGKKTDVD